MDWTTAQMHSEREGEGGSIPEVNKQGDLGGVVHSDSGSSSSRRQEVGCDPKLGLLQSSYSLPKPWSLCKPNSSSKKLFGTLSLLTSPSSSSFPSSFSPLLIPNPHPGPAVCANREQCVSGLPARTCYFSLDTKEEEKQADHLTEKELLLMHGNFIKLKSIYYNL